MRLTTQARVRLVIYNLFGFFFSVESHMQKLLEEAEDAQLYWRALVGILQTWKFFNFSSQQNFYTQYPLDQLNRSIESSDLHLLTWCCSALLHLCKDLMKGKGPPAHPLHSLKQTHIFFSDWRLWQKRTRAGLGINVNNSAQTSLSPPGDLSCLSAIRLHNVSSQHGTLPCAWQDSGSIWKKKSNAAVKSLLFLFNVAQMQIFLHTKAITLHPTRTEYECFSHFCNGVFLSSSLYCA